jgi:tetratricopeptide (TPR) repeat protein
MARRYFNWKLAIVLVVGLAVLCVTALGLRQWQKENRAERGLALGNEAYEEHRYEDAARYLGRYVGVYQDDISALLKYADAQLNITPLKGNNRQQAIGTYHIVLREDPANSEAAKRLIGLYLERGMASEAESIAEKYLETTKSPEVRRLLAMALFGQKKYVEAVAEFQSIIADEPNQVLVYESLGRIAEQLNDKSAQLFNQLSVDMLERIAEQLGDESAQTPAHWYDEAVKNNPTVALTYMVRAGFYWRTGDKAKALAELDKAEELDLTEARVRLRLAAELLNAGEPDRAEQHLIAVELNLTEARVRLHLAAESLNAGEPDKAQQHLIAVKEIELTNQGLWNVWAQLAFRSNSKEKMLEVAENGLKSLAALGFHARSGRTLYHGR